MALTRPKYSQIFDSDFKNSCRVATTGTVTLTGAAPNVVDGVTLALYDRVLVKAQTTLSQNGIYFVTVLGTGANGTWTRALDANDGTRLTSGTSLSVEEGATFGGKLFRMTTPNPINLGVSEITWVDVSGGGGAASGNDGQVQYNDNNAPAGASYLFYNKATGQLKANATTESTSTTTGAFTVTGGVGISGNLFVGGSITATTLKSTGATSSLTTSDIGIVAINVNGGETKFLQSGVEVPGPIYGGSYGGARISFVDNTYLQSFRFDTVKIQTGTDGSAQNTWTFSNTALTAPGTITSSGNIVAASGTASSSTTTGALVVVGGAGISGELRVGANVTVTGNVLPSANVTYNLGSPNQRWKDLYLSGTTINLNGATISATNGSVTFQNSLGGSFSVTGAASGQSTGTFGNLIANSGIASSSTATGALQVTGGAGISGATYVGGLLNVAGATTLSSALTYGGVTLTNSVTGTGSMVLSASPTVTGTLTAAAITASGIASITNATNSTGAGTGALQVTGGASFGGNVYIAGNLEIAGTQTTFNTNNVTIDDSIIYVADNNSADVVDIGLVGHFINPSYQHTGFVRDASDGVWKLFSGVVAEPSTTVDFTSAVYAPLKTGDHIIATTTASSSTSSGALQVAGGAGIAGATYVGGLLNVASTMQVTGTSNHTGASNFAGGITASTVSAGTIGNASATLTGTLSTASQTNVTAVGTLAGLQVNTTTVAVSSISGAALGTINDATTGWSAPGIGFGSGTGGHGGIVYGGGQFYFGSENGVASGTMGTRMTLTNAGVLTVYNNILPSANLSYNIGSSTSWFNTYYGVSTQAKYADLAENYQADAQYEPGTVLVFGGSREVTTTDQDHNTAVAGIVSTNPAHLMNGMLTGEGVVALGLTGRLPCRVQGPVAKGDVLVTSTTPGVAQRIDNSKFLPGCVVGKALESINTNNIQTIEVVVGRF